MSEPDHSSGAATEAAQDGDRAPPGERDPGPREVGGPKGPEPTRYGDWERNGRCYDF